MLKSRALSFEQVSEAPPGAAVTARAPGRGPTVTLNPARLLTMAETVGNMGHWHWYPDTDAMTWSDQIWAMVGLDPLQYRANLSLAMDCTHPEDRVEVEVQMRRAAAEGVGFEFDLRIVRSDGAVRTAIAKGQPEFRNGKLESMFGVLTDVTEAFAAIHSIREQHEMLDLAAELAQLGHWVWNCDEQAISFCSDALARIHDIPVDAMRDRFRQPHDFAATVVPEQRNGYLRAIRDALSAAEPYAIEYRLVTATGVIKDIREIGHPLFDDKDMKRFVGAVQDITEAKRRENEIQEAKAAIERQAEALGRSEQELQTKARELEDLNLQKDKLFSIIAHDLKGPFNAVIGFADLLAARAGALPPDQIADYARIVRDSAISVHGLFDNLLTWAAFQLRDAAPRFGPVDLAAATSESIAPLLSLAVEKNVKIVNAIADTAPRIHVLADEDLLRIVVRNLVSNGIKFCHSGGEVRVDAAVGGDGMVRMTVRDTGVGMAANEVASLFRLDRAVSMPGTRGERGTGLGLYLCRDIVARHGGSIFAEATPAKGSAFHVTLPQAFPRTAA